MSKFSPFLLGFLILGSVAIAGKKGLDPIVQLCESILDFEGRDFTERDLQLLQQSKEEAMASGSIPATLEYADRHEDINVGESVFRWEAHFIGDGNRPAFDSPSEILKGLEERMTRISQQRMALDETDRPLKVFFVAHPLTYYIPSKIEGVLPRAYEFRPDQALSLGRMDSLAFKVGEEFFGLNFGSPYDVVVIGGGLPGFPSYWNDDYVLAHEIAHLSEYDGALEYFKFFSEARAIFYGYLYSGEVSEHPSLGGGEWSVLVGAGKTLDTYFGVISESASHHELGAMLAHHFWRIWQVLEKYQISKLHFSYFDRVGRLLTHASPWVVKDGPMIDYMLASPDFLFTKEGYPGENADGGAQAVFNYLASASMQWAVERELPIEAVEEIGKIWTDAGANAPFIRSQIGDYESELVEVGEEVKEVNIERLGFGEDPSDGLVGAIQVPMTWNSVWELIDHLKMQGYVGKR